MRAGKLGRAMAALVLLAALLAGPAPGRAAAPTTLIESAAASRSFPREGRFVKVGHAVIGGAQGIGYYRLPDDAAGPADRNGLIDVWMPMLFTQGAPSDTPKVGYSAYLMTIDCSKKTSTMRVALSYTREGVELSREDAGEEWQAVTPDSVMDDVLQAVCENAKPRFAVVEGFDALWADARSEARVFGTSR